MTTTKRSLTTAVGSTPQRIAFFGDPHGQFEPVIEVVKRVRPTAIVLLGDLQPKRPLQVELEEISAITSVWFIHGNHDTDSEADYDNLWGSELADRNLDGRIVEIAGLKVAGLGGIFREKVWNPESGQVTFESAQEMLWDAKARRYMDPRGLWREGIALRHRSTIFPSTYNRLATEKANVLVTHEAPAAHRLGFQVLTDLAHAMRVEVHVHGHHHQNLDYQAAGLLPPDSKPRVLAVDKGSYVIWPPDP